MNKSVMVSILLLASACTGSLPTSLKSEDFSVSCHHLEEAAFKAFPASATAGLAENAERNQLLCRVESLGKPWSGPYDSLHWGAPFEMGTEITSGPNSDGSGYQPELRVVEIPGAAGEGLFAIVGPWRRSKSDVIHTFAAQLQIKKGKQLITVPYSIGPFDEDFESVAVPAPQQSAKAPDKYTWIAADIREILFGQDLENKPVKVAIHLKADPGSTQTYQQNFGKLREILSPLSQENKSAIDQAQKSEQNGVRKLVFPLPYLKQKLDDLLPITDALEKFALPCNAGHPVFCVKQADGSYKVQDPVVISVPDECPRYEAPAGKVDYSFCEEN